ncbi:MAG: 16S rRNA (uracil(1498)-N(3))-methyltransferase [Cyclobacteriaceae bacterium]
MPIFYQPLIPEGTHSLDAEEARHATKVLRLQSGDTLQLTDGKGSLYKAIITELSKSACHFSISETVAIPKRKYSIHIAIAPTKNIDRIEWFVEKATEIGIDTISFIQCQNSERRVINMDRITKKAVSAMKQSGQAWLPELHPIGKVETILNEPCAYKYIAHVDQANPKHLKEAPLQSDYLVLIGPEGDFTQKEIDKAIDKGFQKISLGTSTLRTETAGLAACHILNLINT